MAEAKDTLFNKSAITINYPYKRIKNIYLSILLSHNPETVCQFAFVNIIKWRAKTILTKVVTREVYVVIMLVQEIKIWLIKALNLK